MKKEEFMTITNKDIYEEIQHVKAVGEQTLAQALKTNGRVTDLEKKSIGVWISRHPFKFAMYVMIFFAFVISDIRHPMLELIKNLFI